jgi:hypothetical protein
LFGIHQLDPTNPCFWAGVAIEIMFI